MRLGTLEIRWVRRYNRVFVDGCELHLRHERKPHLGDLHLWPVRDLAEAQATLAREQNSAGPYWGNSGGAV